MIAKIAIKDALISLVANAEKSGFLHCELGSFPLKTALKLNVKPIAESLIAVYFAHNI